MCKRKTVHLILAILMVLAVMTGCSAQQAEPVETAPQFTPESYPVVDGSTVTIPLSEALGARTMGISIEEVRQYIIHNKTHQAYLNLISGDADLIFVTSPSVEELQIAKDNQVELEIIPIVSEGFVFLTSADNPTTNLTLAQIQEIYTGKIINWKQLGGSDVPIIAYQRPENSGSQTGFLDLVMKGLKPVAPPTEQVVAEMGQLIDAVAAYNNEPDAIGYSYYYFVTDMWGNDQVKLLSVDGVYPDKESISAGTYPIKTAYYAVVRSDEPKDSSARKLIAWLLTEEGQKLAEEAGYVRIK